jgi:SAM-dependent methyltransferase/uncharacterized protein YbaR (Trm112 family)
MAAWQQFIEQKIAWNYKMTHPSLFCPVDKSKLLFDKMEITCESNGHSYPCVHGVPVLLSSPDLQKSSEGAGLRISAISDVGVPKINSLFKRVSLMAAFPFLAVVVLKNFKKLVRLRLRGAKRFLEGRNLSDRQDDLSWVKSKYENYTPFEQVESSLEGQRILGRDAEGYYFSNSWYIRAEKAKLIADFCKKISNGAPPRRICEVGCGSGAFMSVLIQNHSETFRGTEFSAFDFALSRALIAKTHLSKLEKKVTVWNGDAREIPAENDFFDLCYSVLVLEQMDINEAQKALSEMLRVSRNVIIFEPIFEDQDLLGKIHCSANDYTRLRINLPTDKYDTHKSVFSYDVRRRTAMYSIRKL